MCCQLPAALIEFPFLRCYDLLSRPPKRRLASFNKEFCDLFEHFVIPCDYRLIVLTVERD
jgi:hypothetical protein